MSVFCHVHLVAGQTGHHIPKRLLGSTCYCKFRPGTVSANSQMLFKFSLNKTASRFSLERNWLLPEPNRVTARCKQPVGAIVVTPKISSIPVHGDSVVFVHFGNYLF